MTAARSLADDLRGRSEDRLVTLLLGRPDLVRPAPVDVTSLATRATSGPSIARCLDGLDARHLHVLAVAARLAGAGPFGDADLVAASGSPPEATAVVVDRLVDLALLWGAPDDRRLVQAVAPLVAEAPPAPWPGYDPGPGTSVPDADARAALHARETLGLVRDLIDDWTEHPPGVLRSGGLSLRDFAATRRALHADWPGAATIIEVARAARLVADDGDDPAHWRPTDHADAWLSFHTVDQWLELVRAWLDLPRLPSLADERTQVLVASRDRAGIPVLRAQVLRALARAPLGHGLTVEQVNRVLDDEQPRRSGDLRTLTASATLVEAEALGLATQGALSHAARLLLDGATDARIGTALRSALPEDLDRVVIQADFTVVAPGPLLAHVARIVRLVADVESRGHATVSRISEASIRRALDAGWDATGIRDLLDSVSATPVPQAVGYLIDDVARRHGSIRVGVAQSYVRGADAQAVAAVVADRRLAALGLARLADTVIVAQVPASELVEALRGAGYSPALESPDGTVVVRRRTPERARAPRPPRGAARPRTPDRDLALAVARALLQRGSPTATPGSAPALTTSAIAARLRTATDEHRPVWIGYADSDGTVTEQIVDPIRLVAGMLTAFDHRTQQVRSFAVSRVTGMADAL